jgi:hypothetical protein
MLYGNIIMDTIWTDLAAVERGDSRAARDVFGQVFWDVYDDDVILRLMEMVHVPCKI